MYSREDVSYTLRRHPFVGCFFIGGAIGFVLLVIVAQSVSLIKNLGWIR